MQFIPTLTRQQTAVVVRVSERYLMDVIVARGELVPVDSEGTLFNEAEVLAYREMDTKRRKEALKGMAIRYE